MRNKNYLKSFITLLLLFAAYVAYNYGVHAVKPRHFEVERSGVRSGDYNYSDVLVKRVVDGDTLLLETGERVRLIGIDTPEVHESAKLYKDSKRTGQDVSTIIKLGKSSWDFTRSLVDGKRVSLEFDVEKYDKYDRLLAYVYLKDGTFVNAEIVKQGYASLMTIPPNIKNADLFLKLYQEARAQKRGLWR